MQFHFSPLQSHLGSVFHKVTHKAVEISEKHLKNRILATFLKRYVNNCAIAATKDALRGCLDFAKLTYSQKFETGRSENFFSCFLIWKINVLKYVDFKGIYFCFGFRQFVETRTDTGLARCQERLINKVVHISCG
jgi:hypothetical protein